MCVSNQYHVRQSYINGGKKQVRKLHFSFEGNLQVEQSEQQSQSPEDQGPSVALGSNS